MSKQLLSIVTPAYNEELNLPVLYEAICTSMKQVEDRYDWEWILVDDHSKDETFSVFTKLAQEDPRLRGFRFSKNYGAHKAATCGLREARGDCAAMLAADLQDPPQTIPPLLAQRDKGAQIVWAVRQMRKGETAVGQGFSKFYYWIMASPGRPRHAVHRSRLLSH